MRILFLTSSLPYPPNSGANIRVFQFLSLLSLRHSVTLLTYACADEADNALRVTALSKVCTAVHTVPLPPPTGGGKRVRQLVTMFSPLSYQGTHIYSDAMQRRLDELCAEQNFDIIQLETSQLAVFRSESRVPSDRCSDVPTTGRSTSSSSGKNRPSGSACRRAS